MDEQFIAILWARDGCRCERWQREDGGETLRLYQDQLLLARKPLTNTNAALRWAAAWLEVLTLNDLEFSVR